MNRPTVFSLLQQVASHANTAVQLMELYRLIAQMRQQVSSMLITLKT